jgi:hypothetical protein
MSDIKEFLRKIATVTNPVPKGFNYGLHSFIFHFGLNFIPAPLPANIERGIPKECFRNAALLALETGLTYCEGYANSSLGIPLEHAWVINQAGEVIDNTWRDVGLEYFGVPFNRVYLERALDAQDHYGIINAYSTGFPLFRMDDPQILECLCPDYHDLRLLLTGKQPCIK